MTCSFTASPVHSVSTLQALTEHMDTSLVEKLLSSLLLVVHRCAILFQDKNLTAKSSAISNKNTRNNPFQLLTQKGEHLQSLEIVLSKQSCVVFENLPIEHQIALLLSMQYSPVVDPTGVTVVCSGIQNDIVVSFWGVWHSSSEPMSRLWRSRTLARIRKMFSCCVTAPCVTTTKPC